MDETPTYRRFAEDNENLIQGDISQEEACKALGFSWERTQAEVEAERAHFEKLGLIYTVGRRVCRDRDLPACGSFHG